MTLKNKTFSAVRWTTVAAVFRAALQVAQVAILARLLMPEDYGLMAMVGVVLGYGRIFADFGVNSAYVQRQDVTPEHRSSLFWLNLAVSALLTVIVVALSPLIAAIFGDQRVIPLLMIASSSFLIVALGQQIRMTAEKALSFRPVVLVDVASVLFGFFVAIIAALAGFGVYSLIFGGLTTAAASTVLLWAFLAGGWRPMLRFQFDDVRSYLGFGSAVVGNNIVNEVNRGVDLLLGGSMLSAGTLGLYSIPRQMMFEVQGMINPIVTRVGFPLIAQVQTDPVRVRSIYLKTLNMTASINAPVYLGIAFFSPEIVHIVLGERWHASADLLRVLAVWGFFRATGNPVGSLLLGMGRANLSFRWNLGLLVIVPPILWAGSQFGVMGLAWALLGLSVVLFVPGWLILVRPLCPIGLLEYMVAAFRSALIALLSIGLTWFLTTHIDTDYLRLMVGIVVAAMIYVGLSYKGNREWFVLMANLLMRKS